LVYDGLIHGSIEQQLLEFVRHKFLDRDSLRSKYEEILATPANLDTKLGIAGQCLRDARNCYEENLEKLSKLPQTLQELKCNNNKIYKLQSLTNLIILECNNNNLEKLPKLSNILNIQIFDIHFDLLKFSI
jgi:Leucine-rich repeat (LRR) protein